MRTALVALLAFTFTVGLGGCHDAGVDSHANTDVGGASDTVGDHTGDRDVDGGGGPARCRVEQPEPYLDSPYPSIHGTAGNNERIPCDGPEVAPAPGWHSLEDRIIFNMMTSGTDRLYAVTARTSGCKLWYLDLDDGEAHCLPQEDPELLSFGVLGSSPELDDEGNIYVSDGWGEQPDGVVSYAHDGSLRWRRTFEELRPAPAEG